MATEQPGPTYLKCRNGQYVECDSRFSETGTWAVLTDSIKAKGVTEDPGYYVWGYLNGFYRLQDGQDVAAAMGKTWDPTRQQILDHRTGEYSNLF